MEVFSDLKEEFEELGALRLYLKIVSMESTGDYQPE